MSKELLQQADEKIRLIEDAIKDDAMRGNDQAVRHAEDMKRVIKALAEDLRGKEENKINLELTSRLEGNNLTLCEDIAGQVTTKVYRFEENAIKESLVKLGWQPPKED